MKKSNVKNILIQWKKRKKGQLASRITGIVAVLVIVGILEGLLGIYILNYYKKQNKQIEDSIAETFLTEMNQIFYHVNKEISYMVYEGSEFRRITKAYDTDDGTVSGAIDRTKSVGELKDIFMRLCSTYDKKLNFFYYDCERIIDYGQSTYVNRIAFQKLLVEDDKKNAIPHTKNGKWFLYHDTYIVTIVRGEKCYAGCWMSITDFMDEIMRLSADEEIAVTVATEELSLTQERTKNGKIIEGNTVIRRENRKKMRYADFEVGVSIKQGMHTGKLLLQIVFTVIMLLYLAVVLSVLWYVKHKILKQINYFSENLFKFSTQIRFEEDNQIVEFAEAGKVLNKLADEINKLKIYVYEQRLERQQIELDYAQLQIRPHFYINCLNVIYSMAETGRTKEIQEIALQVSNYLRYIFKKSMKSVCVTEELKFVENYLKVQSSMNGMSYHIQIKLAEELKNYKIPPLLIQTFVENSIKHSVDVEKDFWVWVEVKEEKRKEERYVKVEIRDLAGGMKTKLCAQMNQGIFDESDECYHIGIRNAVKRMRLLYGERAGIEFRTKEGQGTLVEIHMPFEER